MTKRAVCLIPSGEMLRGESAKYWAEQFLKFSRRTATEIVLPAIRPKGPLFESAVQPVSPVYGERAPFSKWVRDAREVLGENGIVWALIYVSCEFLDNNALWQINQYGGELTQVCLVNPVVQEVFHDLISEIASTGVDGIALDLTDAYPNSGSDSYNGIQAHCFCRYCLDGLAANGWVGKQKLFEGPDSLLRYVLKNTETGTAHIDPSWETIETRNALSVLSLSVARNFCSPDGPEGSESWIAAEKEVDNLLRYLGARNSLIASALRSINQATSRESKRSAIILGSTDLDMSQMCTLDGLHKHQAAEEYWVPDAAAPSGDGDPAQVLQFLSGRSGYYQNAFFEWIEGAEDRLILMGLDPFLSNLLGRSKQLMNNKLAPGPAYVVEKLQQYSGFVGIPLGTDDHLAIVERLTREVTGQVIPQKMLEQFRIGNPG
jgi:hypothetical protein